MIGRAGNDRAADSGAGGRLGRLRQFALRTACLYWLLYLWPSRSPVSLAHLVPRAGYAIGLVAGWPFDRMAVWVGVHVFQLAGGAAAWHPPAAGDSALNYVRVLCLAVLAAVAAAIWTLVDRRRTEERTFFAFALLAVRYTLALTLLKYGIIKVFPEQFPLPDLRTLTETFGDASPMHLLWTFMGASPAYQVFGGVLEAGAGALLLFRRTSTLGALLALSVMGNVVMLNFCYDVTAKLYSLHLLLMAAFLLVPDVSPLLRFLLGRREARLSGVWVPPWNRRWLTVAARGLQVLVLLDIAWTVGVTEWRNYRHMPGDSALYGIWIVDEANGLPETWSRLIFDRADAVVVVGGDGKAHLLALKPHAPAGTLEFDEPDDGGRLAWRDDGSGTVRLEGVYRKEAVRIAMHRTQLPDFTLRSRGFRWVEEYPDNW